MWRITFYCDDFYITAYVRVTNRENAVGIARIDIRERFGLELEDLTLASCTKVKYRGE